MAKKKAKIEVTPQGGKQTAIDTRFDLLPFGALSMVAKVFGCGAGKYGDQNWRKIPAESHLNHALRHIALQQTGDKSEDHRAHAATRLLMWLELLLVKQPAGGL